MKIEVVAKTIIFNTDGHLLVLRRHDHDDHRPGLWDLPGGQAEFGEEPSQAAVREVYEETHLIISDLQPVHVASKIHNDCQVVKTIFTTDSYEGSIGLSDEHSEARWINADEFDGLQVSDDYKEAVRMTQLRLSLRT